MRRGAVSNDRAPTVMRRGALRRHAASRGRMMGRKAADKNIYVLCLHIVGKKWTAIYRI